MKQKEKEAVARVFVVTFMTCNRKRTLFMWINEDLMKYELCVQADVMRRKKICFFILIIQIKNRCIE